MWYEIRKKQESKNTLTHSQSEYTCIIQSTVRVEQSKILDVTASQGWKVDWWILLALNSLHLVTCDNVYNHLS